jgi:hypothetical protein
MKSAVVVGDVQLVPAAAALGAVHGDVGVLHQRLHVGGVVGVA